MSIERYFPWHFTKKIIFSLVLTVLVISLTTYYASCVDYNILTPSSGLNSVKQNLTLLKELNLLSDIDRLLLKVPGSECTLGPRKIQ